MNQNFSSTRIQSFSRVIPMIYAYTHPEIPRQQGWIKIGYTEDQAVEKRIEQQHRTADVLWELAWKNNAMYQDGSGEYFKDYDFHRFLTKEKNVPRKPNTEWFNLDIPTSKEYFASFASREIPVSEGEEYTLRKEQLDAVNMTKEYFEGGGEEFLWNAKPRFGKTLAAYDLVRRMELKKVLIVTNRPSISNSWADDFWKFIGWRGDYCFVSENEALKMKQGVMSRQDFIDKGKGKRMIAFESLQGLKGSVYFGGQYRKLEWMAKEYTDGSGEKQKGLEFDLLIVDESHEGVDTKKTDRAFENISRKYTLYLSGTPFKALANAQFNRDQIYNWSYADEQEAKLNWANEDTNPYESLPRMAMYTYQLSDMILSKVEKGIDLSGIGKVDYAFDLNEFFSTDGRGKFVHEEDIKKFLHALVTQEKYPFSTDKLREELSHTLWLLNRVASARALEKLLKSDPVFSSYKVVLAVGSGGEYDAENRKAFDRVKDAIKSNEKTITLSVGQLTVGVTIPEWSGILMLCNLSSPASYMQAAFRAQNSCRITRLVDGKEQLFRKETAYVFDFDPARTLIIFDEFANNLSPNTFAGRGTVEDRKTNIGRLLNFFPVIAEDTEGKMIELDAAKVLSIPRRIKSQEVVRRGFMSNFLFQNISNIFGAPAAVKEIIEKLTPAREDFKKREASVLTRISDLTVDNSGNVEISDDLVIGTAQGVFGPKVYEVLDSDVRQYVSALADNKAVEKVDQTFTKVKDSVLQTMKENVLTKVKEPYGLKPAAQNRLEKQVEREIQEELEKPYEDCKQKLRIADAEFEKKREKAETEEELVQAESAWKTNIQEAISNLNAELEASVQHVITEKPKEVIERLERNKAEAEKKTVEDTVRDHLRGFSRTIPSFIMAYGKGEDGGLTLQNFDKETDADVFLEVTGITVEQFRFLRDGGDYEDPETEKQEHFNGHLFDETVFDDSVKEFWNKKKELANYFDESHTEDIFDYIPPQKTNQIFTPKGVVKEMVDDLERENPGCFNDPTKTFADLHMKSGMYIAEIVKRLFRSKKLKELYPDERDRLTHILREQVYGMAPTKIIYLIATNYILGFNDQLEDDKKIRTNNFVEADTVEAVKNGTLEGLVESKFGSADQP